MGDQAGEEHTMVTILEDEMRESYEKAQSQGFAGVSCEGESRGVFKRTKAKRRVQNSGWPAARNNHHKAPPRYTFVLPTFLPRPFQAAGIREIPTCLDNPRLIRPVNCPSAFCTPIESRRIAVAAIISIRKSGQSPRSLTLKRLLR